MSQVLHYENEEKRHLNYVERGKHSLLLFYLLYRYINIERGESNYIPLASRDCACVYYQEKMSCL